MEYLVLAILMATATAMAWGLLYFGSPSSLTFKDRLSRQDSAALLLLAGGTILFFFPVILGIAWRPAYGGDLLGFLYPTYAFAARSLHEGQIPFWNPYLYSGAPWAFDVQSGFFYPPNLLVFALMPRLTFRTMEFLAVFHFFLTGANTYVCLRLLPWGEQRLSPAASGIGAFAFMFSDIFIIHLGNLNLIAAASWFPIFFLGTVLAVNRSNWRWAAVGGVALAFSILAGHLQPVIYSMYLWGLYLLFELLRRWRQPLREKIPAAYALMPVVAGLGLSALFLLPSYEMTTHTLRARLSYEEAAVYSLAPVQLWGVILPGIFGRGPETFWTMGEWQRVEVGYLGLVPWVLALWALLQVPRANIRFFGAAAILSLLIALGSYLPLYRLLYESLPGFDQMRVPARWVMVFDFALACLAAYGFDHALEHLTENRARLRMQGLLLVLGGLALVGALGIMIVVEPEVYVARRGQILLAAALGLLPIAGVFLWVDSFKHVATNVKLRNLFLPVLVFAELGAAGSPVELGWKDPASAYYHPEAISSLREEEGLFRIDTPLEVWYLWQPDLALLNGFFDISGIYNPLTLADYHAYYWGMGNRSNPLYDFLNARFLIVAKGSPPPDAERWELAFTSDSTVDIYRNVRAYPRFFLVHRAVVAGSHDAVWALIHEPGFDPASVVVLEGNGQAMNNQGEGSVQVVEYNLNRILLRVSSNSPGYLVSSEVFYPDWKARVNGQPAPVLKANYAFRAVPILAGESEVEMSFQPEIWPVGLAISAFTVLGMLSIFFAGRFRRHARSN